LEIRFEDGLTAIWSRAFGRTREICSYVRIPNLGLHLPIEEN
jgi:hypothetical protein